MFIVLGASGHVGSAVVRTLLAQGLPVTAVTHDGATVAGWARQGVATAVVDVGDSDALRRVFQTGSRAFLLNPPADVSKDTDAEERATATAIVKALDGSGLEKVVVESTFGAQPGERVGDLTVLHEFEQRALNQAVPVTIQRGAYYFSNWDAQLAEAREGRLTTMFPPELKIPMVAPADLGQAAAARLIEPPRARQDLHLVEGPERYSAIDVARILTELLERPVEVASTPRDKWIAAYQALGFSNAAAASYARMTDATIDGHFPSSEDTEKGPTGLGVYLRSLIAKP